MIDIKCNFYQIRWPHNFLQNISQIREEMAIANAAARVEVIRNVGEAERNRRVQLEAIAREKGHNLVLAKPDGNSGDIKKEIAQKVMELVPDDARGVTAGPLVEGLLQDSLQKLDLDPRKTREELSIDLVFSLAQQAGVSSEKLKDMLMKMGNSWDVTENRHPLNKIISRLKQQEDRSKQ